MGSFSKSTVIEVMKTYTTMTKPGILFGNALTAIAGFILATKGHWNLLLLIPNLIGLLLVMASGCVLNNCIDIDFDSKMKRTRNRPLVKGLLTIRESIIFAILLLILGCSLLFFFANLLSMNLALFGFFFYVVFYSYAKHYTSHGTLIGSFAGATPPIIGYCAASNAFDLGALLLFSTIVFWQMPHFYAIAIYRFEDYKAASLPVLPVKKGMFRTKIEMMLYILAFMASASLLTFFNYTGKIFLILMISLSLYWLWLSLKGFKTAVDKIWGRKMFLYSLIIITSFSFVIPFSLKI